MALFNTKTSLNLLNDVATGRHPEKFLYGRTGEPDGEAWGAKNSKARAKSTSDDC